MNIVFVQIFLVHSFRTLVNSVPIPQLIVPVHVENKDLLLCQAQSYSFAASYPAFESVIDLNNKSTSRLVRSATDVSGSLDGQFNVKIGQKRKAGLDLDREIASERKRIKTRSDEATYQTRGVKVPFSIEALLGYLRLKRHYALLFYWEESIVPRLLAFADLNEEEKTYYDAFYDPSSYVFGDIKARVQNFDSQCWEEQQVRFNYTSLSSVVPQHVWLHLSSEVMERARIGASKGLELEGSFICEDAEIHSLPKIRLNFQDDSKIYEFNPSAYIMQIFPGSDYCYMAIEPSAPGANHWILGSRFSTDYITEFRMVNEDKVKFGFKSRHTEDET
ncbi:hypothetical protein ABG067_003160 [Albugo candida]